MEHLSCKRDVFLAIVILIISFSDEAESKSTVIDQRLERAVEAWNGTSLVQAGTIDRNDDPRCNTDEDCIEDRWCNVFGWCHFPPGDCQNPASCRQDSDCCSGYACDTRPFSEVALRCVG